MTRIVAIFVALMCLAFSAAAENPPSSSLPASFQFTEVDDKLLQEANELDQQYEKRGMVYRDPEAEALLNRIGEQLTGGGPPPERVVYRFRILRDPMVNAFALPNGSIYVNTGLLALMENEAELAAVLAHEITHVTRRHAFELNRSIRKKALTINLLALAGAGGYFPVGAAFGQTLRAATTVSQVVVVSTVYGYSRHLEQEADTLGFTRLTQAQYDGSSMVRALELLDERIEFEPVEPFWRTHPKLVERIATAKRFADSEHADSLRKVSDTDYLMHMAGVIRYSVAEDLVNRRARTAVARASRLVEWEPQNAVDQALLADGYRSLGAKTPQPSEAELTKRGQKDDRTRMLKHTAEEEQQELLAAPGGKDVLRVNQARAEQIYQEALANDPGLPDAHRGLGMLYEDQGKNAQAAAEYRAYLKLAASDALDRLRVIRRLQKMEGQ